MNYYKGESSVSSGCNKSRKSAKYFPNDDEDVILLSDDEVNDSNNKCMICYCTLTDSQLARVKALMIDCSDSTNIFNNYCNLLNILKQENIMKWDFQKEPMPFCSACLAMVKTLAQLSDKMASIKNQINEILDIIKSEIIKSMKKERSTGKGSSSRYLDRPTPLEKVDYCRSEAIKDLTPEVATLLPKTEVEELEVCNTSADDSELQIGNTSGSGTAPEPPEHVSVSCISHTEDKYRNQNFEIYNQMYVPHRTYKLPTSKQFGRNKRHFFPKETHPFQQNIHEQMMQVSSTQQGNPSEQYQSSKQSYNAVNSSTDIMGNTVHEILLDPSQMSQSISVDTEFPSRVQYHGAQNYNDHNVKENPSGTMTILTEHESDESQSQGVQMEETEQFDPWQFKGNVTSAVEFSLKRFRPVEPREEYIEPPPLNRHQDSQEREFNQGINDTIDEDGSSFINLNVLIVENSDHKGAFCCKICQRRFTTRNSATSHMQAVHLKVKKIQCKFCTKTFFKKFNCLVHINKIHLKGKHIAMNPESAVVYLVD